MDDIRSLVELKEFKNGKYKCKTDIVVREATLDIYLNEKRLVSLASLPQNLKELAWRFLFSEGIVLDKSEILNVNLNFNDRYINFSVTIPQQRIDEFQNSGEKTSGCGSALSSGLNEDKHEFPAFSINPGLILNSMKDFIGSSSLFTQTGGVHLAGFLIDNHIQYFAEDIGRHNAVDKIIGMAIIDNHKLNNSILYCSGRISSEIVKKAVRLNIPMIVSKSAPTSQAIRLGWDYGTYLLGFTRGQRFNIYTGFQKLIILD